MCNYIITIYNRKDKLNDFIKILQHPLRNSEMQLTSQILVKKMKVNIWFSTGCNCT